MTSRITVIDKINSARKYLTILARYEKLTAQELKANDEKRGAVERYLYLAVQATIDLAEAFISLQGFRSPATFSEAFDVLNESEIIPNELTDDLIKMAKFRNLLAHDYEKMNYEIVCKILKKSLVDIEIFLKIVEQKI